MSTIVYLSREEVDAEAIKRLERRVARAEGMVTKLDEVIMRQQETIRRLRRDIETLEARLEERTLGGEDNATRSTH